MKNSLKTRDPMGEMKPLVNSHIPCDDIHGKILMFRARIGGALDVLIGFLNVFSSLSSNFQGFDLITWLGYVLVIFLGLNILKSDDLLSKR